MTGKPLNHFQLRILKKLLQIQKLTNHDIAFVLECDERTIRRRRYEFQATGDLLKKKDVGKNAEKLKPEYLEVGEVLSPLLWDVVLLTQPACVQRLLEWLKTHEEALLEDCQRFLKEETGLETSTSTISRQLKKATGAARPSGRWRRKARPGTANGEPELTASDAASAEIATELPRPPKNAGEAQQVAANYYSQQNVASRLVPAEVCESRSQLHQEAGP